MHYFYNQNIYFFSVKDTQDTQECAPYNIVEHSCAQK